MALMDSLKDVWSKLNASPFEDRGTSAPQVKGSLANGGHTGYHPVIEKQPSSKKPGFFSQLKEKFSDEESEAAPPTYNPPYQQQFAQQGAYAPQQSMYTQQPGAYAPQQSAYVPQQSSFIPMQSAYVPVVQPEQEQSAQGAAEQRMQGFSSQANKPLSGTGFNQTGLGQTGFASHQRAAAQEAPRQQTAYQSVPVAAEPYPPAQMMPQATPEARFVGEDGQAYQHVERLASVTRLADCYRLMEFMRRGESVIACMDLIHDEREKQRCADLLFGAAFSMDCTLTRISLTDTYLISPKTVLVRAFRTIDSWNQRDASARWPGADINALGSYRREEPQRS